MTVSGQLPATATYRQQRLVLLGHAFVAWALCSATMMIGMAVASVETALVVHAVAAPIFAGAVSWNYHRRFGYTTPLQSAVTFVSFVIVVDFFLVALVIEGSLEMFTSPLGTWIPFLLIFSATYLLGWVVERSQGRTTPRH